MIKTNYPDLFLIGAPKCGTTSLAAWLDAHPDIFMSNPKEPNYYSQDVASSIYTKNINVYLSLFLNAKPNQLCGEASTTYLRSNHAIPRIIKDNPSAKFIVALRNPVEMATSVHAQLVRSGRESVRSFNEAWSLQYKRRKLKMTRSSSHNPDDLQYDLMCRLGSQVERLLSIVPRDQIFFVFLEDLKSSPNKVYMDILNFCGLKVYNQKKFPVLNTRRSPKFLFITKLTYLLSSIKHRIGIKRSFGIARKINFLNESSYIDKDLNKEFEKDLINNFHDDIRLLSSLTKRDLSHWLKQEND